MIVALDHIAIAVPDLNRAVSRFISDFELACSGLEDVTDALTTTAMFPISGTKIELVHPIDGQGPIAKYLAAGKEGLHHLCFQSDNIEADHARLKQRGYEFLTDSPQLGANHSKVIFIHPRCCDGVLIELCQHSNADHDSGGK